MTSILVRSVSEHIAWIRDRHHRDSGPYLTTFTDTRGNHYWTKRVLDEVQGMAGVVDQDGNPKYTPHGFRHFAGSWWLYHGANIQDVSWWLGHGNVTITSRIYAKQLRGRSQGRLLIDSISDPFTASLPLLPGPKCNENATG
jgi:integrase